MHAAATRLANEATKAEIAALGAYGSARYLSVLNRQLTQGGPFVCGVDLSIADYAGVSLVTLADFVEFDFSPDPAVQSRLARMRGRAGGGCGLCRLRREGHRGPHRPGRGRGLTVGRRPGTSSRQGKRH